MRVKASALIYAIVFSMIIFIVTLFIVASVYDGQVNFVRLKKWERANDNMQSSLAVLLYTSFSERKPGEYKVDLFGDREDIATIRKEQWGLWEVYSLTDSVGDVGLSKCVLLGYKAKMDYALAILNTDKILNIAGATHLKGDLYAPGGIYKYSYIEGRPSAIGNPVEGALKRSQEFKSIELRDILNRVSEVKLLVDKMKFLPQISDTQTTNSFHREVATYFNRNPIALQGVTLHGKILIASDKRIAVDKHCKLEDVILLAPEIELGDYFEGTVQCFADTKIIVGEHVHLFYPSVLAVIQSKTGNELTELTLKKNSIVGGEVILASEKSRSQKPLFTIEEEASFYGQIFSDGLAQLQGKLIGNCCIGGLYLKTRSAVYDNTMLDCSVDSKSINSDYFDLIDNSSEGKEVIKWLN